jgi:hypothetical protein
MNTLYHFRFTVPSGGTGVETSADNDGAGQV